MVSDLPGNTPARVNRITGDVYLSAAKLRQIRHPDHLRFIILHEQGHIKANTRDEIQADAWAFQEYAKKGYSLKNSVTALAQVLSGNNPEHYQRTYLQLKRALAFDCRVNGHSEACDKLTKLESTMCGINGNCGCAGCTQGVESPVMLQSLTDAFSSFTGCQPGEKPAQCRKRIRTESKAAARENRSAGFRAKREAKVVAAQMGIAEPSVGSQINAGLKSVGGIVGNIFGRGGAAGEEAEGGYYYEDREVQEEKKSKKTALYLAAGVGGLLVVGVIIFLVLRAKGGKK